MIATLILAAIAGIQAYILATTDTSARMAAEAAARSAAAADSSVQLAKQEQRPIIWLANDVGQPELYVLPSDSSKGQITWSWHFTNYGKTPALHVSFSDFLIVNGKQDAAFEAKPGTAVAAPLPSGNEDFASIISQNLTTREQFSSLMNADRAITIEGKITYSDAAGNSYSTIFCLRT